MHSNYPFMHPDDIELTQPMHGPEQTTNTTRRRTWKG